MTYGLNFYFSEPSNLLFGRFVVRRISIKWIESRDPSSKLLIKTCRNRFYFRTGIGWLSCQPHAIGAGSLRFHSRASQIGAVSPMARQRCDVSSTLCCLGAQAAETGPATRSTLWVILRVWWRFVKFHFLILAMRLRFPFYRIFN